MRGTGRTSEQIRNAPAGAIYVTGAEYGYTKALVKHLGREDLRVVHKTKPGDIKLSGLNTPIVYDHFIIDPD